MNDNWMDLLSSTIFLSPDLVKRFFDHYGNAIVAPPTIRGNPSDYGVQHNSGYPVLEGGKWYSLWGMRPSRWAASIAVGLKKGDLEKKPIQKIECCNGSTIHRKWTVHHVYECGLPHLTAEEKSARFTNLSNLVLMGHDFHQKEKSFIHGEEKGAQWLRWVISELFPEASKILNGNALKPANSPGLDQIYIAQASDDALNLLIQIRKKEPAGNKPSTLRLKKAIAQSCSHPCHPHLI
jgi:hypothetical protein